MQLLLSEVESGLYDGVVCVEIERLSRGNPADQFEILETFKSSKTKVYTLNKVYDLNNEELDEEIFEFALFMSRREYKVIKRRLLRGRLQSQREGYFIGSNIPYGYDKVKQGRGFVLVPNDKAENVKLIFKMIIDGYTVREITNYLNATGITPHSAVAWCDELVRKVIRNQTYTGKIYAKAQTITYEGKHEAIIDSETFALANSKIKGNPRTKKDYALVNPLAGLVRCASCGHMMRLAVKKGRPSYLNCRYNYCPTHTARLEKVESRLLEELKAELANFNYFLESESEEKEEKKRRDKELSRLKNELKKKKEQLAKTCDLLESGVYSVDLYKERSQVINENIDNINKNIDKLETAARDRNEAALLIPNLNKVLETYPTLSPADKNKLLKSIIKVIDFEAYGDDFNLRITLLF